MQGTVLNITSEGEMVRSVDVDFPRATPPMVLRVEAHERIGQGSFGTVYRATSNSPKFPTFALKVAVGKAPRLEQELLVMRKVCTKGRLHVAGLEFVALNEPKTMLVAGLELCLPLTLHDFLVSYRLTSEVEMMYLASQVLTAVSGVHEEDCVHRDIKLQNFVFDLDCNVKLIDFGLAFNSITPPPGDVVAGTVSFMAPEMASNALTKTNRSSVGAPADVWSVGIVLFSIVTQRSPYPPTTEDETTSTSSQPASSRAEVNQSQLVRRVAKGQWVWPAGATFVSTDLRRLIESMIVLEPSERPTIRQVLAHPMWSKRYSPPKGLKTFLRLDGFDTLLAPSPEHQQHLLRNVERKSQMVNLSRAVSVANDSPLSDNENDAPKNEEQHATAGSSSAEQRDVNELDTSATVRIEANASRRGLEREFEGVLDEAMCKKPARSRSKGGADTRSTAASLQRPAGGRASRSQSRSVLPPTDDDIELPVPALPPAVPPRSRSSSRQAAPPMPMPVQVSTPPPTPRSPTLLPHSTPAPPQLSPTLVPSKAPSRGASTSMPRQPTGAIATSSISQQRRERSRSRSQAIESASQRVGGAQLAVNNDDEEDAAIAIRPIRPTKRVPVVQIHTPSTSKLFNAAPAAAEETLLRATSTSSTAIPFATDEEEAEDTQPPSSSHAGKKILPKSATTRRSVSQEKKIHDVPVTTQLIGTLSTSLATEERKHRTALARLLQSQMDHFIAYLWVLIEEDQTRYNITWLCEMQAKHIDHAHQFQIKKDDKGPGYDEGFVCDACLKCYGPKKRGATVWEYYHCSCGMDMCASCYKHFVTACTCPTCKVQHRNIMELRSHACRNKKVVAGSASPPVKRVRDSATLPPPKKSATPQRPSTSKKVQSVESDESDDEEEPPKTKRRSERPAAAPATKATQRQPPAPAKAPPTKASPAPPAKPDAKVKGGKTATNPVVVASSPSKAVSAAAASLAKGNKPVLRKGGDTPNVAPPAPPIATRSEPLGKWKPDLAAKVASKPPALPPPTPDERAMLLNADTWLRYFHYASTTGPKPTPATKAKRSRSEESTTDDDENVLVYQIQPGRTGVLFLGMDAPVHSVVYAQKCMLVVGSIDPTASGDLWTVMPCTTTLPQYGEIASIADTLHREDERLLRQRRTPGTMSVYQPPMSVTRAKDAKFQYIRWFRCDDASGMFMFLLSSGAVQVFIGTDAELRWNPSAVGGDSGRRFLVRCNGVVETVDRTNFPLMDIVDRMMSTDPDIV